MSDSSDQGVSSFSGLRLNHVRVLLGLVTSQVLREKGYVKRRFLEHASDFDRTLAFLTSSHFINDDGSTLSPTSAAHRVEAESEGLSDVLLSQFAKENSQWRAELFEYLRRFRVCGDKAIYRANAEQRSSESAVRNFLMELAAISHDSKHDHYVLNANCHPLFVQACSCNVVEPSLIRVKRSMRDDIGLAAEHVVVEYERDRLGPEFADRVEHVALSNVAAGFDVQSVTVQSSSDILSRFIEVKAVSPADFRFYWTANEIATARTFGAWYYLYLLPVGSDGRPKTALLRMVCDPHNAVLECPDQWSVDANVVECRLATDTLMIPT